VPLGSFYGISYDEASLPLATNDVFVFCSDGVSEAMNERSEEFTPARLIDVVRSARGGTARDIVRAIVEAVEVHRAGFPPNDDMTVVALKITG
jgi:sigma-B regulation protein RsbU (phosphoserine phosphatase)